MKLDHHCHGREAELGTSFKIFETDIAIFTKLKATRLWDDFLIFVHKGEKRLPACSSCNKLGRDARLAHNELVFDYQINKIDIFTKRP